MKIAVDGKDLFELSATQKKVIKNDIGDNIFDEDMKRRLQWVLNHKYERCFERLKQEWMPKLQSRLPSVPTDPDALAELIFSQSDYKNAIQRNEENKK